MKDTKGREADGCLGELVREVHHRVEAAERARISQSEMAARLGVSARSYVDYLHGRSPAGMRIAFDLLAMLDEIELVAIVQRWREHRHGPEGERSSDDS